MEINKLIKIAIQQTGHQPFLFVGSGFSKRYMNTESWDELLRIFSTEYSENEFQYNVYANMVEEKDYYGKQPAIATLLEKDYNNAVLTLEKYKEFRQEYKKQLINNASALKIAIAKHFQIFSYDETDDEISLIKKLGRRSLSGIITTNYDTMLEQLFPDFKAYIGQEELIFANITGIGEIYKIHGSVMDSESLVLTSKDYMEFEEHSSYLIAKLLTIFLEYPIIFLGYSLNDKNIRNIFETVSKCLTQEKLDTLKTRLFFVNYSEEEKISEFSMQFKNGSSVRMNCISTVGFMQIYNAIYETKSKYNPAILRHLRQDIYELANSTSTSETIVATGFENLDDLSKADKFILGVGITKNGHMIKAEQLYEDIVFDNQHFNPVLVIEEYLPELLKNNSGGLPMYKYLRDYQHEVFERVKDNVLKYTSVDAFLNQQLRQQKQNYRKFLTKMSVQDIVKVEGIDLAYRKLIFLEEDEIEVNELLRYLQDYMKKYTPNCLKNNSELKRLIRIYDMVKYK